jgi:uncharacterized membrane protein
LFSIFFKKSLLSANDNQMVLQAIAKAERQTSGEIRVYIESRNPLVSTMDRAQEIFVRENMHATAERNGVLIYLATKDREVAIVGDEGIHTKVGSAFWEERIKEMLLCFRNNQLATGLTACIQMVGKVLSEQFPYVDGQDKNELSDDILFGK